ncbi:MAG: hypothetical protein D6705_18450 [Deltaproteobacteria bacterium]|nr:MAG: hypothetical protein D6705_18450 [Deltaproteobacteria bacterium]
MRRVRNLADFVEGRRVVFEARAVADPPLIEPLERTPCLAAVYRAWPPATTVGVDGASAGGSRGFEVRAEAFAPFFTDTFGHRVRVLPASDEDLVARHDALLAAYGINLRCEVLAVPASCRVRVEGWVRCGRRVRGSPHREDGGEIEVELIELRALEPLFEVPRAVAVEGTYEE